MSKQVLPVDSLHQRFLSILPRIELHGHIYFRHIRCRHHKEDLIAEMAALAWKWFLRLAERGKDVQRFLTVFISFAARAVRCGRRVCGQEKTKDALSPLAQKRHGLAIYSLPNDRPHHDDVLSEALRDNTQTPPDEQAAFRIDFPRWRSRHSDRDGRLIDDLMAGEPTLDVARKHGLSPGRISQLRREFHEDWQQYHNENTSSVPRPGVA